MGKNILILEGSPRKGANTERLSQSFARGAQEAGHDVSVIRAADLSIGGCRGCNHCFYDEKGVCVQKDDMAGVLEKYGAADILVFATPVYYFNMTAQLKTLIDRTYALLPFGRVKKSVVMLLTCGNENRSIADPTIATFRQMMAFQQWDEIGYVLAEGLHAPDEIVGRKELDDAYALGKSIE